MKYKFGKSTVVALGGSIIHPGKINAVFVEEFKRFIENEISLKKSFLIVAGGGSIAREYQDAASKIIELKDDDKDYLGIHATRLNAHFLRTIFFKDANPTVIDKRFKLKSLDYLITIASGWKPGWSTDYVAMQLAHDFEIREVIVAGSPSHVFTCDPQKFSDAEPIEKISWSRYREMIPGKWVPGAHFPIDPVAARFAEKNNLKAIIIKGTDLKNFQELLAGREFIGTIVE